MKTVLFLMGLIFAFSSFAVERTGSYIYDLKVVNRFKVTQISPYKDHYILPMKYRMMLRGTNNVDNHFCAIVYQFSDKSREGVVFWQEGKVLISWQLEGRELDNIIIDAHSMLTTPSISYGNIVPRAEITMEMALYAKEDVDPMRTDCQRNGDIIVIKSFATPAICSEGSTSETDCIEALNAIK